MWKGVPEASFTSELPLPWVGLSGFITCKQTSFDSDSG